MKTRLIVLWSTLFTALSFAADPVASQPKLSGFPFTDEDLNYSINWPTGSNLGEAHLHAKHTGAKWNFSLSLDAGLPGFALKDTYSSVMGSDYCSVSFDRSTTHGSHTVKELETIDRDRATALHNKVDIPVPACVKDALTYLFYSRRELGQGRVPAAQEILFGALHTIRVDYLGAPMITVNGKQVQSDKVTCTVGMGSSDYMFDVYYARDAARTPLLITAPFAMGKFSMELIR
jgi:hypothetical protein